MGQIYTEFLLQRLAQGRHGRKVGQIGRHAGNSVEIPAQRNRLFPAQAKNMADMIQDIGDGCILWRREKMMAKINTDQPFPLDQFFDLLIGQVAGMLFEGIAIGMGCNNMVGQKFQHLIGGSTV